MNGNECGVKGVELLAVFGTSMSKGFLDNGVPETIKGRNILGQILRCVIPVVCLNYKEG